MILFLDFDGVLHPIPLKNEGFFCRLDQLEEILRGHPSLQVVITSSWREQMSWEELQGLFSDELQGQIVDMTSVIPGGRRHDEIQAWLREHAYIGEWIALDDNADEFPPECPQLCLCATKEGFDFDSKKRLVEMLIAAYRRQMQSMQVALPQVVPPR